MSDRAEILAEIDRNLGANLRQLIAASMRLGHASTRETVPYVHLGTPDGTVGDNLRRLVLAVAAGDHVAEVEGIAPELLETIDVLAAEHTGEILRP